ncbi:BnaUnng03090D, partial [Brassica napus]
MSQQLDFLWDLSLFPTQSFHLCHFRLQQTYGSGDTKLIFPLVLQFMYTR